MIPDILNGLRVQKISVHNFGQFLLSNCGFVLSVMPHLTRLKHLKINIENTFCQNKTLKYPDTLQSLTLTGFQSAHIDSFLYPLTLQQTSSYSKLRHLKFEDIRMLDFASSCKFFSEMNQICVHTVSFVNYTLRMNESEEDMAK